MNTNFKHREIHKFTRKCLGRGLQSIIDYYLVRADLRRDVNDVKVTCEAEIGSDHHLVLIKLKPRTTEKKSKLRHKRLQTNEGKLKYCVRLSHRMRGAKCE